MRSALELLADIRQFEQAKNFGSLIVPKLRDPAETLRVVEARDFGGDLLLKEVQARVVGRAAHGRGAVAEVSRGGRPTRRTRGAKGLEPRTGKAWLEDRVTEES